jgi:hypothetical protein
MAQALAAGPAVGLLMIASGAGRARVVIAVAGIDFTGQAVGRLGERG